MLKKISALLLFLLFGVIAGKSCDLSDLSLDSVICTPSGFDIHVTLCIGAGTTPSGQNPGANGATTDFAFFLFGSPSLSLTAFTPAVVSDSTGVINIGVNTGAQLGAQQSVLYSGTGSFTCISNPIPCGLPHRECHQFLLRTNVLPDSICAWGVEGNGNPFGGCYGNTDMCIGSFPISGVLQCPAGQVAQVQSSNCMAAVNWTPPLLNPLCASMLMGTAQPGDSFAVGLHTITYTAQINGGANDSCSFLIEVVDTLPL